MSAGRGGRVLLGDSASKYMPPLGALRVAEAGGAVRCLGRPRPLRIYCSLTFRDRGTPPAYALHPASRSEPPSVRRSPISPSRYGWRCPTPPGGFNFDGQAQADRHGNGAIGNGYRMPGFRDRRVVILAAHGRQTPSSWPVLRRPAGFGGVRVPEPPARAHV